MAEESWKMYSSTLQRLLRRPELRDRFQQDMDGTTTTTELNISTEMRADIKKLLLFIPLPKEPVRKRFFRLRRHSDPTESRAYSKPVWTPEGSPIPPSDMEDTFKKNAISAEQFFYRVYQHLRRGAVITTVMSVLIFVMGLVLLAIAAAQVILDNRPGTAITLAASGVLAIGAAFYRSPVTQMRESAAAMQRSNMILMSYMLGLSLLSKSLDGKPTAEESSMLTALTKDLVSLLPGGQHGSNTTHPEDQAEHR